MAWAGRMVLLEALALVLCLFQSSMEGSETTQNLLTNPEEDEDLDMERDLGHGSIQITIPHRLPERKRVVLTARSEKKSTILHAILVDFDIPQSNHHVRCELAINRKVIPDKLEISIDNELKEDSESCQFVGVGMFDSLPYRTKCLFSFCHKVQYGLVWLPGDESMLVMNVIGKNASDVSFVLKGKSDGYSVLKTSYEPRKQGSRLDEKTRSDVMLVKAMLGDFYPSNWYYLRVKVWLSKEAFYSDMLNGDLTTAVNAVSSAFNIINVIYSQINITVLLKSIEVVNDPLGTYSQEDWFVDYPDKMGYLLGKFAIRSDKLNGVDFIVFIRNLNTRYAKANETSVLGLSPLGVVCTISNIPFAVVRTSSTRNTFTTVLALSTIIAHEMAHGLGADHPNGRKCVCPSDDRRCLMHSHIDPQNQRLIQWGWSNCSRQDIADHMKFVRMTAPHCLGAAPGKIDDFSKTTTPVCGNAVLERGEECDCGPGAAHGGPPRHYFETIFCQNKDCCDYSTCKLKAGAQCANGICCDFEKCLFYDNLTVCRTAVTDCDLTEFCTGSDHFCPVDRYYQTGTPCPNSAFGGTCYEAKCVSRKEQCAKLMGGGTNPEITPTCLKFNKDGTFAAYCRNDSGCAEADVECGSNMCVNGNVSFWDTRTSQWGQRDLKLSNGTTVFCYSFSTLTYPDSGHTEDGMLCNGGKKYCKAQKCELDVPQCDESPPCDNFGKHVANLSVNSNSTNTVRPFTLPPPHVGTCGFHEYKHLILNSFVIVLTSICLENRWLN